MFQLKKTKSKFKKSNFNKASGGNPFPSKSNKNCINSGLISLLLSS